MTSRTAQHAVSCVSIVCGPSVLVTPAEAVPGAVLAELLVGAHTHRVASIQTSADAAATEARAR